MRNVELGKYPFTLIIDSFNYNKEFLLEGAGREFLLGSL